MEDGKRPRIVSPGPFTMTNTLNRCRLITRTNLAASVEGKKSSPSKGWNPLDSGWRRAGELNSQG